ncbi:RsmE family RNA methyltransferase [Pelagicoccus sp. SDUM812003]|uniref:RsmE family RNA methyltransferase n=1 Tax=Pelagicoccus sp. SDUM812003 TaxID=3041267 RepID=UPI00280F5FD1|nr:RsmE family RNA methyltransferase [Pelagicoccus sp. SDUM812003]MDQ8203550.1 RsmE family RNA methyltransferase [Pelagicoccus sp. SDUM812003]
MPDYRCFCQIEWIQGDSILLSPEESNHLVAANRARKGDPVRVFDGAGHEWDARLVDANKRKARLQIEHAHQFAPPEHTLALAQAVPKGKLMESIIRKATEIGTQQLYPILTSHTESRIEGKRQETKNQKWEAATLEGAKQSGNPFLMRIEPLQDFSSFLENAAQFELKLIASLAPGAASLKTHWQRSLEKNGGQKPRSVIWLVGPEGDFTPDETQLALSCGFLPTTLGPHVMRCETAAQYALSITQYELTTS